MSNWWDETTALLRYQERVRGPLPPSPYTQTFYTLARIYDVSRALLAEVVRRREARRQARREQAMRQKRDARGRFAT